MASSRKRQARKHTILDPYLKPVGWKEGLRVLLDEIKHISKRLRDGALIIVYLLVIRPEVTDLSYL